MARKKKKKPKAPPLSAGDKALYNVMVWGCLIGTWIFSTAAFAIGRAIAFASGRVIARSISALFLPYWAVGAALSALFCWMQQKRYPIFGNREVKYGPPQYNEVYPLLGRYEVSRRPSTEWKKTARTLKCLWLLSFVLLFSVVLQIAPGYVLTEEYNVEVYDRIGHLKEIYGNEQLVTMELEGTYYRGRYGSTKTVTLRLKMSDGEDFSFDYSDFDNADNASSGSNMAISSMQHIKNRMDPAAVTITGVDNLPKIVDGLHLSSPEEAQLYALFEMELP